MKQKRSSIIFQAVVGFLEILLSAIAFAFIAVKLLQPNFIIVAITVINVLFGIINLLIAIYRKKYE